MRVEPRTLTELLHRQVDPKTKRDVIGTRHCRQPRCRHGPDRVFRHRGAGQRRPR